MYGPEALGTKHYKGYFQIHKRILDSQFGNVVWIVEFKIHNYTSILCILEYIFGLCIMKFIFKFRNIK